MSFKKGETVRVVCNGLEKCGTVTDVDMARLTVKVRFSEELEGNFDYKFVTKTEDAVIEGTNPDVSDLIEKYEKANRDYAGVTCYKEFLSDLKSLSTIEYSPKPEKVRLPKPIADYLEISKGWDDCYQAYQEDGAISLQNALSFDNFGLFDPLEQWFSVKGNDEIFAEAWIDGYKVEVESKYWAVKTSNDYLKAGKEIVAISNKPKAQEIAELIGNGTSVVPVPSDFLGFCYVDKEVSK